MTHSHSSLATGVIVGVPIKISMLSYLRKKVSEGRRKIGHSIDVLTYNEQIINALSLFVIVNQGWGAGLDNLRKMYKISFIPKCNQS